MSRLTVGSLEGLAENSNVISVPAGHTLNAVDGVQLGGENITPYTGRKNFLINGSMLIAQRATTATSTTGSPGYISLDRWYCSYQDSGSLTIAQNSVNSGGIGKSMRLTVNTSGSFDNSVRIQQAMETVNVIPLQGKTVTISADVKLLTSSATMHELGILYHTSSTDFNGFSGWTSQNLTNATSQCTTNTWSKVSVTLTVPSNAVSLAVDIGFQAGSGNTGAFAEVSNVQLELGDKVTPFEHRSYGEELRLCQRYYEEFWSSYTGWPYSTTQWSFSIQWHEVKRTTPSQTLVNGYVQYGPGGQQNISSIGGIQTHSQGSLLYGVVPGGLTVNSGCVGAIAMKVDAEL